MLYRGKSISFGTVQVLFKGEVQKYDFFNNYPFGALNKIYKPIWIQSLYVLQYMYEAIILYKSKYFFAFFAPCTFFLKIQILNSRNLRSFYFKKKFVRNHLL